MKTRAFSIVELIIVIAVIGILAAILIPVFSNIIEKANAKSALSDAKNTLTNYVAHCESNEKSRQDLCIIVEKAKSYYAFIYEASTGELNSSDYNPLTADSLDDVVNRLLNSNVLVSLNENSKEFPLTIPNQLENVVIYEGYRLEAGNQIITLNKKQIGISLDENYTLVANVFPQKKVLSLTWESKDNNIATVQDGVITPVSYGETEIIAHYGEVTATCKVVVDEFIEFSGSMAELKTLIEDESDRALFIKLMSNVELIDNTELFPIVIPEDKIVRLDFNGYELNYRFSSDEYGISAFVENNGGDFYMYCSGGEEAQGGYFQVMDSRRDDKGNNVESESVGHILVNKNGGYVNVGQSSDIWLSKNNEHSYAVYNIDGIVEFYGGGCTGVGSGSVMNCENGKIIANESIFLQSNTTALINYGVVESISHGIVFGHKYCIRNYGLIKSISGAIFLTAADGVAIENIGRKAVINQISDGTFGTSKETETSPKHALVLKDGSAIGAITGGTFNGVEAISCDESPTIIYGISGGEFTTQVPARLLAPGKTCIYNEETDMYDVK